MTGHSYHEWNYGFGQTMLKLHMSIDVTQVSQADLLGAPAAQSASGRGAVANAARRHARRG